MQIYSNDFSYIHITEKINVMKLCFVVTSVFKCAFYVVCFEFFFYFVCFFLYLYTILFILFAEKRIT